MTLSKITKPITDKDRDDKINGLIDEFDSLAGVAITGSYNDLTNKPTIPDAQVQSNWNETDTSSKAYIKNKPTIPTVNNATLTIQKNGTTVKTFTANASSNVTCNITVPTDTQDLTNGAGYTTNTGTVTSVNGVTPVDGAVSIPIPTVNNATLTIQKNGSTVKTFTANASSNVTCNITVPTKTSDLSNDEGYGKITGIMMNGSSKGTSGVVNLGTVITSHQDISGKANIADLATVATSGSYTDLSDKPTIPTVGNGTITINQGGTTKGTFTTNQSGNSTINLDVGGTTTNVKINNISITSSGVANIVTNTAYNSSTNKIATMSDLPAAQVQADWTVTNTSSKAYIKNKPTIPTVPTALSSFTDDLGSSPTHTHSQYLTSHQDISGKANTADLATVATSGSYNDLTNKPTIPTVPTNVSAFTNDAGYIGSSSLTEVKVIVDSYSNGSSWYRKYSDGWCEQGGTVQTGAVTSYPISLLVEMRDTNYTALISNMYLGDDTGGVADQFLIAGASSYGKSPTTLRVSTISGANYALNWQVSGYMY